MHSTCMPSTTSTMDQDAVVMKISHVHLHTAHILNSNEAWFETVTEIWHVDSCHFHKLISLKDIVWKESYRPLHGFSIYRKPYDAAKTWVKHIYHHVRLRCRLLTWASAWYWGWSWGWFWWEADDKDVCWVGCGLGPSSGAGEGKIYYPVRKCAIVVLVATTIDTPK